APVTEGPQPKSANGRRTSNNHLSIGGSSLLGLFRRLRLAQRKKLEVELEDPCRVLRVHDNRCELIAKPLNRFFELVSAGVIDPERQGRDLALRRREALDRFGALLDHL